MYKHLYDNFSHWYHGGSVYFYSDPHFADEEMKYLRKNYIGDDEQVRAINKKIGKKDTIIFLGDIGDVEFIKKIRGYKVLVMGNHDAGASNYKRRIDTLREWIDEGEDYGYYAEVPKDNHLFDEVYEGPLCISEKIILSHEPLDIPFMLNIHGHDHSGWAFQDKNHINVCAEHIEYCPVGIKEIVNNGMLGKIDSIHRITIDMATDRKKAREKSNAKL